jgi:hypothetical protein
MILFLLACGPLKKVIESPEERIIRLRTEYREEMRLLYEESGLALDQSGDGSLLSMATNFVNSIGQEALEEDCLRLGRGYEQTLGLDFLKKPEVDARCKLQALKAGDICALQEKHGQPKDPFCQ